MGFAKSTFDKLFNYQPSDHHPNTQALPVVRSAEVADDYSAFWSDEDQQYVGLSKRYPSLSWLEDTEEAALAGVKRLVAEVEEDIRSEA